MPTELQKLTTTLLREQQEKQLSERRILDLASRLAACHPALQGRAKAVRSFLTVEASWQNLVDEIAGEPCHVIDLGDATASSLQQTLIAGEAVAAIWDEDLLTSSEAARRLGAKPTNREKVNALRRRSRLLGLPRDGGSRYLYPAFQIDPARCAVYPEAQQVNTLLEAESDPWGVASWWISNNDRLGARPKDLVGTADAEAIVHAARAVTEVAG